MSWQEYQNDRREQEQLEIIRALIEDATKDTTLWLQDDPSAEERVHVLAIQTGLADLARIVERRMERRKLPKDEWEYSETVSEVLSRLEKARKLRGNIIVGRGLGHLTERLPQELPGAKARGVTQAHAAPHDWHEELRRARNMEDDFGLLTFGHAWDAVRMLAQANDPIEQEKRIDSLWRMYPEAAEKLGLPKLPTNSLSQVKPSASSSVESQADRWRTFRNEFEQLAREERPGMTPRNRREWTMMLRADGLLYASVSYRKHPEGWPIGKPGQGLISLVKTPECGLWIVAGSVRENFQERFRALAARAGVALAERFQPAQTGSPKDTEPEDFWLHQLFLDLRENNSDHLFAASDEGGRILHVCEASATFCARLERKALETNGAEERSRSIVDAEEKRKGTASASVPILTGEHWKDLEDPEKARQRRDALYKFTLWSDIQGALKFGEAWRFVKKLARIESEMPRTSDPVGSHREREGVIETLLRSFPTAAEELGLPRQESRSATAQQELMGAASAPKRNATRGKPEAGQGGVPASRLSATINCPSAARRMEAYLQSKAMSLTEFAIQANTTDRTLRSFRQTGKVRRDIFETISKAMNITKEELLKPE